MWPVVKPSGKYFPPEEEFPKHEVKLETYNASTIELEEKNVKPFFVLDEHSLLFQTLYCRSTVLTDW